MNATTRTIGALLLGAIMGGGAVAYVFARNADEAAAKFSRDWLSLSTRLSDANSATRRAQEANQRASSELASYRRSVEERDRAREARLRDIIGQASQGGNGASEIASGLDGDIALARSIADRLSILTEGLRRLQAQY